ncbi:MAG: hypothetical protein WDW38_010256 [Sanguina aurantia]
MHPPHLSLPQPLQAVDLSSPLPFSAQSGSLSSQLSIVREDSCSDQQRAQSQQRLSSPQPSRKHYRIASKSSVPQEHCHRLGSGLEQPAPATEQRPSATQAAGAAGQISMRLQVIFVGCHEQRASILFLGRPGVGKTTAIREVCRMFADDLQKRVVIVDTSNEIGGDGDIAHAGIGRARRMQVSNPEEQHRVMIEAVENHMPEVIVIDEIGTEAECIAARTIAQRGVQLVATAHGNELQNVLKNPSLADLVGGIQSVTLGDEEAKRRGVQKSILERAGPPTFDVAVEMLERTKWRLHMDVGKAVDILLAGGEAGGQVRERAADGSILKYHFNPSISGAMKGNKQGNGPSAGSSSQGQRPSSSPASGSGSSSSAEADLLSRPALPGRAASTFVREPAAESSSSEEETDEFGSRAKTQSREKLVSRQAVAGLSSDSPQVLLRIFPFEIDVEKLWEVMASMGLTDRVFIASKMTDADAVLSLRTKLKTNTLLRNAASSAGVPVYAMKNSNGVNLVKALRTLIGADSSAGGTFARDDDGAPIPHALRMPNISSSDDLQWPDNDPSGFSSGSGSSSSSSTSGKGFGNPPSSSSSDEEPSGGGKHSSFRRTAVMSQQGGAPQARALPSGPSAESQGLEEVRVAVEQIVMPLQQPVELMPRSEAVIQAQIKMVARYGRGYEVMGSGLELRLRILPTPLAANLAAA